MFPSYRRDERTENEKYLESELERERYERQEKQERDERERQARAKEEKEQREYDYRHPDNWPEAFRRQASLCWREHNLFPDQNAEGDDYFKVSAEASEAALKIWQEVYAEKQKLIEEINNSIRSEVADRLTALNTRSEYRATAQSIRDDALDSFCDW